MAKLIKIVGNSILIIIEVVLIFVIAFAFLIRTPQFQTFLAHQGADLLSNQIDSKVSIGKIDIAFFDRVYFDKLYIEDQHQDTLFYIDEFYVNYRLLDVYKDMLHLKFQLDKVKVSNANVKFKKYKGEDDLNLMFFIDAFRPKESSDKKVDFQINVDEFELVDSRFAFIDENKEHIPYGVDYTNLGLRNINIDANDVLILPKSYQADFNNISFLEKSGFELDDFVSNALFNDNGLTLGETYIGTEKTNIYLDDFKLRANSIKDFSRFVDSVKLESHFDKSFVSLKDVAYFAPQLEGMTDIVMISGATENAVNDLQILNTTLRYGRETMIKGDFSLVDFRKMEEENWNQSIDHLVINVADLKSLKLPNRASTRTIPWPESLVNVNHIEARNLSINGKLENLQLSLTKLNTDIGIFNFEDDFIVQTDTTFSNFHIESKRKQSKQINIEHFEIDKLVKNPVVSHLNGYLSFKSTDFKDGNLKIKQINGELNQTKVYGYEYDYILFDDVNYDLTKNRNVTQNQLDGSIYVRDENLDLTFDGLFRLGRDLEMKAKIDLECAKLDAIHPSLINRGELITSVVVDAKGRDFNDFIGTLSIDSLYYEEGDKFFQSHDFVGFVERTAHKDSISIVSDILDVNLYGEVDYSNVIQNIGNQLGQVFPAFITIDSEVDDLLTHFNYVVEVKNINNLLAIFYPALEIADLTKIDGYYDGKKNNLGLNISSEYVAFEEFKFNEVYGIQEVTNQELLALIDVHSVELKDSVIYKDVHFTGLASDGALDSQIIFDDTENKRSNVEWLTNLYANSEFDVTLYPSHVVIYGNRWNLDNQAFIAYQDSCLTIDNVKVEYKNQYISAGGHLSNYDTDKLYLDIMSLDLAEFGDVFGESAHLSGIANVSGYVTTPKSNLQFHGEAIIEGLKVNETEVGVVGFSTNYDSEKDKINMSGDILSKHLQTFKFEGDYGLKGEEKNKLDFSMNFNQTDISVVNEFLDPNVINNIQGKLNGDLQLSGTLKEPLLEGKLDFTDGMFNLAILGANMYLEGEVVSEKEGIYINKMPLRDQEGNTGFINGSLFHNNFKDFYFEVFVNLEEHPTKRMPNDRSRPLPVERFLVMNTVYDMDVPYYGDAYVTGIAEISGEANNLSIVVNAKTKRGTKFVLPMYGPTTIEEDGFITFKKDKDGEDEDTDEKKVDLTGLDLELNIEATPDAEAKLIFDEKIGDEISARGSGNLTLTVDQFNELAMEGTYTVANGFYNFAIGPYSQKFEINPGGTVQWVGDPYEAILNIEAFYKTTANLSVVMPDVIENQLSNNEEVYSYLNISGNMSQPDISFDIDAPRASESGKAIINRIRSDKDELNQQFFSIIISKSFMPLAGQVGGSGQTSGAFLDLASSQINNILNRFTEGYNMNVNLESDDLSGQFSGEFGLSKSFLDNRLFVSGSFGVGTRKVNGGEEDVPNQNTFIGDVRIEYLLNKSGSFRGNVFNESNNNYILQNEGRGQFTQGIGLSYKEDFNNMKDFKLLQLFANIFRRRENWVEIRESNSKQVVIPKKYREDEGD